MNPKVLAATASIAFLALTSGVGLAQTTPKKVWLSHEQQIDLDVFNRCGAKVEPFNTDCTSVSITQDDQKCQTLYHVFANGRRQVIRYSC